MKVLIVGLGTIALKHINALRDVIPDVKIFAFRSTPNAHIVEGVANIYHLDELEEEMDFVIISNSTHLHFKWIELLIDKKWPLFIEKPAVHALEGVEELIQKIKAHNTLTYVACNLRFHHCLQYLKEVVEQFENSEVINEVNVYCGTYLPDWRPGKDWRSMYSANAEMGGGAHLDLFHELDYTTWICGQPKTSKKTLKNLSSLNIDAVDYANYSLEYDHYTANVVLNYYRRDPKRQIEIVSSEKTIIADLIGNRVIDGRGRELYKAENFSVLDTYVSQIRYFVSCVATGKETMNNLEESIKTLRICIEK